MENIYPYLEAGKVCAAYAALLYLWPSVMFGRYLRGKGLTFRFMFCNTAPLLIINGAVLGLGLLRILNDWTVRLLFWGTLAVRLAAHGRAAGVPVRALLTGSYGWKLFLLRAASGPVEWWRKHGRDRESSRVEYGLLAVLLLFGCAFFSNSAFQSLSYGTSDMFTHHEWAAALGWSEIFPDGVYPEAMHCFLYAMHSLFGVELRSCMLFLAGIYSSAFLTAAYCLMKELFRRRYTALFVLAAWLTFDGAGPEALESMARMTWTLPEEFGLYLVLLCPLALIRFLRERRETGEWYQDENLLVFALGVGATLAVHFYVTIMAFFSCLAAALVYLWRIGSWKRLWFLAVSVFYGAEAGVLPMLAAYVMGKELQGSLRWGLDAMQGGGGGVSLPAAGGSAPSSASVLEMFGGVLRAGGDLLWADGGFLLAPACVLLTALVFAGILMFRSRRMGKRESHRPERRPGRWIPAAAAAAAAAALWAAASLWGPELGGLDRAAASNPFRTVFYDVHLRGYTELFGEKGGFWIAVLFVVIAAAACAAGAASRFQRGGKREKGRSERGVSGYLYLLAVSELFVCLHAASSLGLPSLIAANRIVGAVQLMVCGMLAVAADLALDWIAGGSRPGAVRAAAVLGCAAIYCGAYLTDFHTFAFLWPGRCRAAAEVTQRIVSAYPRHSYTVVSMYEERYQVMDYGRHEELLSFVRGLEQPEYSLPTEYIFLYVEKRPVPAEEPYFASGPSWLGRENVRAAENFDRQSSRAEISRQAAEQPIAYLEEAIENYLSQEIRTALNSRAYIWCQDFAGMYPAEVNVYYEDDDFVCYVIRQDTGACFNLSLDGR